MKKLLLLLVIGISLQANSLAQNVSINEDFPIAEMMNRYVEQNKSKRSVDGWRIQITATTDRQKVEAEKRKFLSNHPGINVDWTHSKPYYRLRAGAFLTKLEAIRLLYLLKKDYPSAYPAKDNQIPVQELLRS